MYTPPNAAPGPYEASVLADSIARTTPGGTPTRLITLAVTMPRIVLAEFNTHRVFSRNSASSRAIPVHKRIAAVEANPYVPLSFGRNRSGMQATEELDDRSQVRAEGEWRRALAATLDVARDLVDLEVHKQHANRLLEPFSWHTVIVTATEWRNFFALRISKLAQPEIRLCAEAMLEAIEASTPVEAEHGQWHLPLVTNFDGVNLAMRGYSGMQLARISAARCARVSYLTHDGKRDVDADELLAQRLFDARHMSPFEHQAVFWVDQHSESNFARPWTQYRKLLGAEAIAVFETEELALRANAAGLR